MANRRPRGCLIDLGDNRWRPVVTAGYVVNPLTGKKKQVQKWMPVFEGGRRAAQKHLDDLNAEVAAGELVRPSRQTVGEYLTGWIRDEIAPPHTAKNTYLNFKYIVENHIVPSIGHVQLQQLSRAHVKAFLREKERALAKGRKNPRPLSKNTVRLIRDVLHSALADALEEDLVRRNAAALRDKKRRKRKRQEPGRLSARNKPRPKAWTEEEQRAIIEASVGDTQIYALTRMAFDSGMRRGELLGTLWTDFEPHPRTWGQKGLGEVTVTVRRQLASWNASAIDNAKKLDAGDDDTDWRVAMFGVTKSGMERTFDLIPETVEALRKHYREQQEFMFANRNAENLGLVFTKTVGFKKEEPGRPLPPFVLDRAFRRIVAKAKVPALTFHSCRHSTATTMLLKGIAPVVVAERLGHADVSVTLAHYNWCLPAARQDAARVRREALGRRN